MKQNKVQRRWMYWAALAAAVLLSQPHKALSFCGFYVGKADASLYNEASQVAMVRNGNRTVISMASDYKGDLKEFALVVPVPVVLKKEQVHVGDKKLIEHIDAYSAPRLVEYFDEDPCNPPVKKMRLSGVVSRRNSSLDNADAKSLGVTIEAQFTVGEYDIVILSAKESDGLETWLIQSGYKIPLGASAALKPYITQKMKFFVAKVNLEEQAKTGLMYLRPLQFAFESEKFMLPIRLGMINSKGSQDLLIYVLTKEGRVETTNYRTVKLPTGMDIPEYVKDEFAPFYKAMFSNQVKKENERAVFTEYFWNMGWCDPCAAEPLSSEELKSLGVFWLEEGDANPPGGIRRMNFMGGALPVMLTRLHVRYSKDTFPEDLMFQETKDTENFQGRYVLRHPWKGDPGKCEAAKTYLKSLEDRHEKEAQSLASLTGWEINDIRKKMQIVPKPKEWWENLWK